MLKILKIEGMSIFVMVWLGQLVSFLGSSITNFALYIWVYQQSNSISQLSFVVLFTNLPYVLLSPFAGVLVDNWNRRWVMFASDLGAALSTLAMVVLLYTGQIEIWHIYLINIINNSSMVFKSPAYSAATTDLVPKEKLGRANGMIQLSQAVGQLLSPLLGGVLLGIIQISGIVVLDLVSFLFALTTLLLVRFPDYQATENQDNNQPSLIAQALYSLDYLKARSGLMALLLFFALSNFLIGILEVLVYPLMLSFASPAEIGTIMSVGGVGMTIGSLLMITWGSGWQNYVGVLFCFMLVEGFAMTVAGFHASVFLAAIAALLFFLSVPFINSCGKVIFQKKVDPDVQGRVFSLNNAISSSCQPLACLVAAPLADGVFEPLMRVDGPLAGTIGQIIGTGSGRGIGLMFIVLGVLTILITTIAYQYAPLRLVEDELPDVKVLVYK